MNDQIISSITNHVLSIAQSDNEEYDIPAYVTPTKKIILVPESGATIHVLFTKDSAVEVADQNDLLVPSTGLTLEVGERIGRLSAYNSGSSGAKKLYIGIAQ